MDRAGRPRGPESAADDIIVGEGPFLDLTLEQIADRFPGHTQEPADPAAAPAVLGTGPYLGADAFSFGRDRSASRWGLRYFLMPSEGAGYWDNFRPLGHTVLSIAHATYRNRAWAPVHGEGVFKLRLLLSGRFLDSRGDLLLEGPAASLSIHPRGKEFGYYIAPNFETKLVILHCHPETLTNAMGLTEQDMPTMLSKISISNSTSLGVRKLSLSPKVFEAAIDMIRSRYEYSGSLRANFLEAKCKEILCSFVNDLNTAELERKTGVQLSARDLNRVLEARDYLANHFCSPPSIPVLARRIGVNQTKLKQSFRQVMGTTLHAFVQDMRMRAASEMLLSGERTIAEVGYAVGYDHAANFTYAFKKYYGFVPRALKPKR